MKKETFLAAFAAFVATAALAQPSAGHMDFTVSFDQASNHLFHVVLRCDGLKGGALDYKMPAWTPGFYSLLNFAQYVENFHAEDAKGRPLAWQKTSTNTWRVGADQSSVITLTYDVRATRSFVATPYVDASHAYIMPAGLCLYLDGQIKHPVTITLNPPPAWTRIATGLDPTGKPHTFAAPNFDILYDSPILAGNLDELPSFEIRGVRHSFYGYNLGVTNGPEFIGHLRDVIAAGVNVIGEVPYNHYTFIGIGAGRGGIEHLNSTSFGFSGASLTNRAGTIRQLEFLAHEYFHNYNVKRIRPIELGPFDYERENRTRMLWVSEGLTVYYEYIMLSRSGNLSQGEVLDGLRKNLADYENTPGRLLQSVIASSWDTWAQGSFGGGRRAPGGVNKTISYYDKGPVLGLMLDFKIRHETGNKKSLDTVMRTLYRTYYKEKQRGWTEDEFRAVCEDTAGVSLSDFFGWVNSTDEPDYATYFAYAGLEIEPPKELPDADLGAVTEMEDDKLVVLATEPGSPARTGGLAARDVITACDGAPVTAEELAKSVAAKKPGDKITLTLSRDGAENKIEVVLGHKLERSWKITPIASPNPLQSEILRSWLEG